MGITVEHGPDVAALADVALGIGRAQTQREQSALGFQQQLQSLASTRADRQQKFDNDFSVAREVNNNQQRWMQNTYAEYMDRLNFDQQQELQQREIQGNINRINQMNDDIGLRQGSLTYTPQQRQEIANLHNASSKLMSDPTIHPVDRDQGLAMIEQRRQSIRPMPVPADQQPVKLDEKISQSISMWTDPRTGVQYPMSLDRNGLPRVVELPGEEGGKSGGAGGPGSKTFNNKLPTMQDRWLNDSDFRNKAIADAFKTVDERNKAAYEVQKKAREAAGISATELGHAPPTNQEVMAEIQRRMEIESAITQSIGGGQTATAENAQPQQPGMQQPSLAMPQQQEQVPSPPQPQPPTPPLPVAAAATEVAGQAAGNLIANFAPTENGQSNDPEVLRAADWLQRYEAAKASGANLSHLKADVASAKKVLGDALADWYGWTSETVGGQSRLVGKDKYEKVIRQNPMARRLMQRRMQHVEAIDHRNAEAVKAGQQPWYADPLQGGERYRYAKELREIYEAVTGGAPKDSATPAPASTTTAPPTTNRGFKKRAAEVIADAEGQGGDPDEAIAQIARHYTQSFPWLAEAGDAAMGEFATSLVEPEAMPAKQSLVVTGRVYALPDGRKAAWNGKGFDLVQ